MSLGNPFYSPWQRPMTSDEFEAEAAARKTAGDTAIVKGIQKGITVGLAIVTSPIRAANCVAKCAMQCGNPIKNFHCHKKCNAMCNRGGYDNIEAQMSGDCPATLAKPDNKTLDDPAVEGGNDRSDQALMEKCDMNQALYGTTRGGLRDAPELANNGYGKLAKHAGIGDGRGATEQLNENYLSTRGDRHSDLESNGVQESGLEMSEDENAQVQDDIAAVKLGARAAMGITFFINVTFLIVINNSGGALAAEAFNWGTVAPKGTPKIVVEAPVTHALFPVLRKGDFARWEGKVEAFADRIARLGNPMFTPTNVRAGLNYDGYDPKIKIGLESDIHGRHSSKTGSCLECAEAQFKAQEKNKVLSVENELYCNIYDNIR